MVLSISDSSVQSCGGLPAELVNLAEIDPMVALGSLDGRYRSSVAPLVNFFSEAALNRARLHVEVQWLIWLTTNRVLPGVEPLSGEQIKYLQDLVGQFGKSQIERLAEIEAKTLHDVKAVEYLLKDAMVNAPSSISESGNARLLGDYKEVVHIFCTSEDINNLSYALLIKNAIERVWLPKAKKLLTQLTDLAQDQANQPMLSHTHGQPATPTTLGHEIAVWVWRLSRQLGQIKNQEYLGKINGATGNFAAHLVAVPGADWPAISRGFVEHLGLTWNPLTTQIESHDWQGELYDAITRFNRIAHNMATDIWTYISMGYFHQNLAAQGSTGSSTMPHKVNPIRFENAEANLEISSALLRSLSETLLTSRLQRDLTDSSTQRNIGTALGHCVLAIDNLQRGLSGLEVAEKVLETDLDNNWEVLAEAVQQAMRAVSLAGAKGLEDPYERLKELTRGHKINAEQMRKFIEGLGLPHKVEQRLMSLEPRNYHGLAAQLVAYLKK